MSRSPYRRHSKPLRCPRCASGNVTTGTKVTTQNSRPVVDATCGDCGNPWKTANSDVVREATLAEGKGV